MTSTTHSTDGEEPASVKKCPHANVVYCPLYHAAHEDGGLGCDDGWLDQFEYCGVSRSLNYDEEVAKLPQWKVAELAFREGAETARQQRITNMRTNGIKP